MHKSYRLGKNLSHQTQIFCWITETHSQPIQGYLPSPWVFLRLDIISRFRGGRREGHDPQCHESTHASPGIGLPCSQPLSQPSHWRAVTCSWWHGPFMSTYFLCSFHAMLERLRIILLPPLLSWSLGIMAKLSVGFYVIHSISSLGPRCLHALGQASSLRL